jgi:hypothetical protein
MAPYLMQKFWRKDSERELKEIVSKIEQYVAADRMDTLLCLCNYCVYKMFDDGLLVSECTSCDIHQGITEISIRRSTKENFIASFARG